MKRTLTVYSSSLRRLGHKQAKGGDRDGVPQREVKQEQQWSWALRDPGSQHWFDRCMVGRSILYLKSIFIIWFVGCFKVFLDTSSSNTKYMRYCTLGFELNALLHLFVNVAYDSMLRKETKGLGQNSI